MFQDATNDPFLMVSDQNTTRQNITSKYSKSFSEKQWGPQKMGINGGYQEFVSEPKKLKNLQILTFQNCTILVQKFMCKFFWN